MNRRPEDEALLNRLYRRLSGIERHVPEPPPLDAKRLARPQHSPLGWVAALGSIAVLALVIGALVLAARPNGSEPGASPGPPAPSPPPADDLVAIDRATLSDDRGLVQLQFVGGPPFSFLDACSNDYAGWARIDGDLLELAVYEVHRGAQLPLLPLQGCPAAGYQREIVLELAEPFHGSTARDIHSGRTFLIAQPVTPTQTPPLPTLEPASIYFPTHNRPLDGPFPAALMRATMVVDEEAGCVWFVDGEWKYRKIVVWPRGFELHQGQDGAWQVLNLDGEVAAVEGARRDIGGGELSLDAVRAETEAEPPARCYTDTVSFWLTSGETSDSGVGETMLIVVGGAYPTRNDAQAAADVPLFRDVQGFYVDASDNYRLVRTCAAPADAPELAGNGFARGRWLLLTAFRTPAGASAFLADLEMTDLGGASVYLVEKLDGPYIGLGQEEHPDGSGPLLAPLDEPPSCP